MSKLRQLIETVIGSDALPTPPDQKVVFIYHDISNPGEPHHSTHYSTTPEKFKEQIDFISKRFEILQLDELLQNESLSPKKKYAAITFDDGFYSVRLHALPFLKSRSISFSVFLNKTAIEKNQLWLSNLILSHHNQEYLTGILNENSIEKTEWNNFYKSPIDWILSNFEKINVESLLIKNQPNEKTYLSEEDVTQLFQQGVFVGSHSVNHTVLSKIDHKKLSSEIFENKHYLETLIGKPVNFFAIPFGKKPDYNEEVIKACRKAGHTKVLTSNPSAVSKKDEMLIPRIGLTNESIPTLKFYLNRPYFKKIDI
jgi:peptidoglycan/xylan/chitin deacetylase (PgdA/CDA1 family)